LSIIESYIYRDGTPAHGSRLRPVDPSAGFEPAEEGEFAWVEVADPTREELVNLQEAFGLPMRFVEQVLAEAEVKTSKVEVHDGQLFVLVKTAHPKGEAVEHGWTAVFVGPRAVISLKHGWNHGSRSACRKLEASSRHSTGNPGQVLHGIIDLIVDDYASIVAWIERCVLRMEEEILDKSLDRDQIKTLFRYRRQLIRTHNVLAPLSAVCNRLLLVDTPCLGQETRSDFRDTLERLAQLDARISDIKAMIGSVFETNNVLEQNLVGETQRQLAAWAAIAAVPAVFAGLYGMNFDNIPGLKTPYGFHALVLVILTISGSLFWKFKKIRWL
jgi:magnesium transporter